MWWSRKEASPPPEPAAAPAALPVTRAEWRSVPPIQRVLAEHPLVNPVQRFSSSLTSWQSPGYLEPLGHRVGPEEPAGVIGDLARPRTLETPAPAMPVVQRATRKRSGLSRLWGASASVQREASPEAAAADPAPAAVAETVQLLPEEPAPLPSPSLVLPVVSSREVVRPLTSAAVIPASPPVRTVQAIPEPAAEPSVVDTPAAAELPPAEPDSVATVPVPTPEPAPAESSPAEPARPVLPVVQRTEQAAPRRLGLGAPILPDPGSVSPPAAAMSPPVVEDAPLAGALETTVLPAEPTPEPTQVADDVPLPVSRLADTAAPSVPPSAPLSGTSPLKPVQRLRDESSQPRPSGSPVKDSLPAPMTGKESFTDIGTPGEVTVSRMEEAPPELPTVTSSRSSPVNTFRPLDIPEIRSGTTEPPGTPGGSTSVSAPAPLPVARAVETPQPPATRAVETPALPVARAVETSQPAAEIPQLPVARAVEESATPSTRALELPVAPTIEASAAQPTAGSSPSPVVPTVDGSLLPVARAVEDSPGPAVQAVEASPLPVTRAAETPEARVVEGSPPPVTRATETPALPVARVIETPALPASRAVETPSLPMALSIETPALPVSRVIETPALPVARSIEGSPLPVARAVEDSAASVTRAVDPPPLPVARTLDAPAPTIPPLPTVPNPTRHTESAPLPTLPTLPVSRAIETSPAPMTLPIARVLDAPTIQRLESPGPAVMNGPFITAGPAAGSPVAPMLSETLPVAHREERAAAPQPGAPLPVARSIDSGGSAESFEPPRPPMPVTAPLPVARVAERTTNGRASAPDFPPTVQRADGSAPQGEGLTLNLPPVVVSRQAEVPIIQREPEPPPPAPAPEPAAPEAPAAAAAPPPAAAQPETDELVKKLFDPLLRRLKTELRLDRERRGALTDRPH